MKIKNITGIILLSVLTAVVISLFSMSVSASTTEATTEKPVVPATQVSISSVTISGSVNNELQQTITLNANNGGFVHTVADLQIDESWNMNLPRGLEAIINGCAKGSSTLKITIKGKPEVVAENTSITMQVPAEFLNGASSNSEPMVVKSSNAKWNIVQSYELIFGVKGGWGGTLAAKVDGTAVGKRLSEDEDDDEYNFYYAYIPAGKSVVFTATPTKDICKVRGWTSINKTGSSDTSLVMTPKDTADSKTKTLAYPGASVQTVEVEVEFAPNATAYRFEPSKITSSDRTSDNKVFDITKETKMNFGDSITINLPADAVTTNAKKKVGNNEVYIPAIPADGELNEFGTYEYEIPELTISSGGNIVKIVPPEDNDDAPYNYKIIASGEGTAKLKFTVKHLAYTPPDNSETSEDEEYALKDGVIEFTVTIGAAKTDLAAVEGNKYAFTASTLRLDDDDASVPIALNIDFKNETAYAYDIDFDKGGYSLDGGKKWTALMSVDLEGNITGADISDVLEKGGSDVRIAEELENAKPVGGKAVWKIGKINARPTAPKATVAYGKTPGGISDGTDDDNKWYFEGVGKGTILFYAPSKDGKTPEEGKGWKEYDPSDLYRGETILPWDSVNSKVVKTTYLAKLEPKIKIAANTNETTSLTPASKTAKITVSGLLKAPNVKVDYKKETVTVKNGMYYVIDNSAKGNIGWYPSFRGAELMNKAQAKVGVAFAKIFEGTYITADSQKSVYVYTAATGKKPKSAVAELIVNYYKEFEGDVLSGFNESKYKYKLPRGLEVFDPVKQKWVTSLKIKKTVGAVTVFEVREKGNAKYDPQNIATNLKLGTVPASQTIKLKITWGEYTSKPATDKKDEVKKQGVVAVDVE